MSENLPQQPVGTAALGRYRILNCIVASDVALPAPVASSQAEAGLTIAEAQAAFPAGGELLQEERASDGGLLFNVRLTDRGYIWTYAAAGSFLISRDGSWINWQARGTSRRDIAALLSGPVIGLALQLQGKTLLHGNGLVREGRALGLIAATGSGKSSLTASLLRHGLSLLSDDVLAIAHGEAGPALLPAQQRLKLWPDSLGRLLSEDVWGPLERYVSFLEKRLVPAHLLGEAAQEPAQLAALYLLSPVGAQEEAAAYRLRGQQAVIALVANSYQGRLLRHEAALQQAQLARYQALNERVPVCVLFAPRSLARLEETATVLLTHFDNLTGRGS